MDTPSSSPSIPKRFHALVSSASQLPNISFLSTRSSGSTSQSKSNENENNFLLLIDPKIGSSLYMKLFNFHKKMPNEDFYFQRADDNFNIIPQQYDVNVLGAYGNIYIKKQKEVC